MKLSIAILDAFSGFFSEKIRKKFSEKSLSKSPDARPLRTHARYIAFQHKQTVRSDELTDAFCIPLFVNAKFSRQQLEAHRLESMIIIVASCRTACGSEPLEFFCSYLAA